MSPPRIDSAAQRANGGDPAVVRRSNVWIGLGLGVLSALMLLFSQLRFGGIWPLALIGIAPAIVSQYRFMPRKLAGIPIGLAFFGVYTGFASTSVQIAGPWAYVLSLLFAIAGLIIGSFDRKLSERTGFRWFLLQLPVTWTAFDLLYEDNLLLGNEGELPSTLAFVPSLIQPISIFGEAGLAFVIILFNCTVALAIIRLLDRSRPPADGPAVEGSVFVKVGSIGLALSLLWVVVSLGMLSSTRDALENQPKARIAAIQQGPGLGVNAAGWGEPTQALYDKLARMTREAAEQGARMAVWGEVALYFDPRVTNPDFIPSLARETGMYIQVGWTVGAPDPKASNMTGLWGPDGKLIGVYYKIHPVVMDGEDFDQPVAYPVFDTDFGKIGMIICFDMSFEAPTRLMTAVGAQIMTASTGDWTEIGPTRLETVVMRAVENRVSYVKDESLNGSGIVDASGTVLAKSFLGSEGGEAIVIADVPLGTRDSIYTRIGPVFGWICVVALVVRIWGQGRLWRRARRERRQATRPSSAA